MSEEGPPAADSDDPWAVPPAPPNPPRPPPGPGPAPAPAPAARGGPYGDEPINTGGPASIPPGALPWETDPWRDGPPPLTTSPGWGPPDPAAVSGPPWPVLVASGPYTPPPLIRWPIAAGLAVLVLFLLVIILTG